MSAETQQSSSRAQCGPAGGIVQPQPISDRGLFDNVTDYISDIVPQVAALNDATKDSVQWVRIETHIPTDDLLIILGYATGVNIWSVNAAGEAKEVLSWRRGAVRTLRLLPDPSTHDSFPHKRPIIALCDATGPGPQFCSLSFVSLRIGDQLKIVKYKNPVNEVVCTSRVIVVTFATKLAILDAGSLEERRAIVTCFPVSGPNLNPIALGPRWLAFAERRLSTNLLSGGGAEAFGPSVKATMLYAAKSLGKAVANSLVGQRPNSISAEDHPGVVSILDLDVDRPDKEGDDIIAHFVAHSDPIVAMSFDPSGLLLLTADKRGHDFHVFRILPYTRGGGASGTSGAAVHHLYVLHRGDTAAKVQSVAWTIDSRWVSVSTLRGTTHVFGVSTYGGPVTARTHLSQHVVNRQSRFHRSAGLMADGRNSPETVTLVPSSASPNPRLPPFPHPTVIPVMGQIRVPQIHSAYDSQYNAGNRLQHHNLASIRILPEETAGFVPVRVAAHFGTPRAAGYSNNRNQSGSNTSGNKTSGGRPVSDVLHLVSTAGVLVEYELWPRVASCIPKEKTADDSPIELIVEPRVQWPLLRITYASNDLQQLPLPLNNPLMTQTMPSISPIIGGVVDDDDESWMSQVEITTHVGPHRRLWMGPQFMFKTYTTSDSGKEGAEPVDIGSSIAIAMNTLQLGSTTYPPLPVLMHHDKLPRMRAWSESSGGDSGSPSSTDAQQLAESLADAMLETAPSPELITL